MQTPMHEGVPRHQMGSCAFRTLLSNLSTNELARGLPLRDVAAGLKRGGDCEAIRFDDFNANWIGGVRDAP